MGQLLEKANNLDARFFKFLNAKLSHHYEGIVKLISRSGDGYLYIGIGLLLIATAKQTGVEFFVSTLIAFSFELPIYFVLKNSIRRERPEEKLADFNALICPSDRFSFPSGHTAAAFVFACSVFNFYPDFGLIAFIWAGLIGLSRVMLGVHYPGDILAGMALGISSSLLGGCIISLYVLNI